MALVAEYDIGCPDLPLVGVAAAVPDAALELQIGANRGSRPPFVVHVTGDDEAVAAVEREFESTAFVGDYTLVGRDGETRRYKILPGISVHEQLGDVLDDPDRALDGLYTTDLHLERIRATPTGWVQTGRFADQAALEDMRAFWGNNDVPFRLRRLVREDADSDGTPAATGADGLTDPQREALLAADELGYFDVPRRASLDDVAAELGISASACSERLRRAQTHLVETFVDPRSPTTALKEPHD